MRFRILLTAALAILVGVLTWYLARTTQPPGGQTHTVAASLDPAAVTQIHITRPGKDNVTINKEGTKWQLSHPLQIPANPFRINSILSLPGTPGQTLTPANETDLKQLGLLPPQLTLRLNEHVFQFGNVSPLEGGRYLLYDNMVYVIEDTLYHQLLQNPGFFVSPRLFNEDTELTGIQYPEFELLKQDDRWIQSGGLRKLSAEELDIITSTWAGLEAVGANLSSVSNRNPDIVLRLESGEEIELSTESTSTGLILSRTEPRLDYRFSRETGLALGIQPQADD